MNELPKRIYDKLLTMPVDDWRKLRALVRWRYTKGDRSAPPPLKSVMVFLWQDPRVWQGIAKQITAERTKAAARLRYKTNVQRAKDKAEKKRAYMKAYMQRRRAGGAK